MSSGVSVGVQYLGEGVCPGLMLVSKDVKGVRDAKESPARCRFARWCLVVPVAGVVVASMEWVPTRHVIDVR